MTKIYYKKESIFLWYILLLLGIGLIIFGWWLVDYFAWQSFLIFGVVIPKIISINKNPMTPVIELSAEGLRLLSVKEKPFFPFENISEINMDDRAFNGYLRLKHTNEKVIIDSVAIPIKDQREICELINTQIKYSVPIPQS